MLFSLHSTKDKRLYSKEDILSDNEITFKVTENVVESDHRKKNNHLNLVVSTHFTSICSLRLNHGLALAAILT